LASRRGSAVAAARISLLLTEALAALAAREARKRRRPGKEAPPG
jgi:hypothetical protein